MSDQFKTIRTPADAEIFQDEANGLHDGYITHVEYHNGGISDQGSYLAFDIRETSLILHVLVTSMIGHPTEETSVTFAVTEVFNISETKLESFRINRPVE